MIFKGLRFLISLKFGIFLLIGIALYIVIGTLIPQNMPPQWYIDNYDTCGPLIVALSFYKVYSTFFFNFLVALFGLNLAGCTLAHLRGQLKQCKDTFFMPLTGTNHYTLTIGTTGQETKAFFKKKRFAVKRTAEGFLAAKYRWGVLGSSITHGGIIIVIIGGLMTNLLAEEGFFNLLPGQEVAFEANGFSMVLDDFYMTFDEQGRIEQYYSDVSIYKDNNRQAEHTLWVNKPLTYQGISFYQSSFGWAGYLIIRDRETGEIIIEGYLRNGQDYFYQPAHISIYLHGYYPDFAIGHENQPVTRSQQENNPYYGVVLYEFGRPLDSYIMEPGQNIIYENLAITFDHSAGYTGILYRKDPSYYLVLLGFIVMMIGLTVSFYLYPRFAAYRNGAIYCYSKKNNWIFQQWVDKNLTSSR